METSTKYREQEREESTLKWVPEVAPRKRYQEDGRRRRVRGGEEGKYHQVPEIRKKGKEREKQSEEEDGRSLAKVTNTAPILEGSHPRSQ